MSPTLTYARPIFYFRPKSKRRVITPLFNDHVGYLAGVNLTDEEIAEFKVIYERTTGLTIDFATAREKATKLMTFVHALVRHSTVTESSHESAE